MWIIIIAVLIFVIFKFLYDRNKQASKITKEGGMKNKYRELIEFLMRDSRTKIFQETSDSITLGISSLGGTTLFILIQTFGHVTVQWKVDNPLLGKHKLEWRFDEYDDQEIMTEKIANDIQKYQDNVMNANGLNM